MLRRTKRAVTHAQTIHMDRPAVQTMRIRIPAVDIATVHIIGTAVNAPDAHWAAWPPNTAASTATAHAPIVHGDTIGTAVNVTRAPNFQMVPDTHPSAHLELHNAPV